MDYVLRSRILKKLKFYALQENPLNFAKRLTNRRLGEYRFRVGNYRILFDFSENGNIKILKIGHRSEIYFS